MSKKEIIKTAAIAGGIGFLVGAVIAIFYSPKSGKQMREMVTTKTQNAVDKVKTIARRATKTKE